MQPLVDDMVKLQHHKGAFQDFFKGDDLRDGEYIAMITSTNEDDLHIGRFAAIQQGSFNVDIVNCFAKFEEITVIEAGKFFGKINIPAPFFITLKNCTPLGTKNFRHSISLLSLLLKQYKYDAYL